MPELDEQDKKGEEQDPQGETPADQADKSAGEKPAKNWQNEAEKFERLLKKSEGELTTFKTEKQQREDAEKSDLQKAQDAAAAAQRERDEAKREAAVVRAAAKHGLTEDDYEFIAAGDPEQIETRAQKLADRLKVSKGEEEDADKKSDPAKKPRPLTKPGNPGSNDREAMDKERRGNLVKRMGIPGVKV